MPQNISAPYEAQFKPDGESEMFAHSLPEILGHVSSAIRTDDKRFRGFCRVTNHDRSLVFAEVNVLGGLPKASPTVGWDRPKAAGE